ncbi:hypothetical protein [Chromohalobacter sp. 296-RDG]|uniref:hypothetical protein n=1 Tax=Chromohalobacter sp. 296-RDG TaxID=2994062 RepID=UPI00246873B9|nr:hypothetical protein [Chromohalobacter sp. 296-RDG]
MISKEAVDRFLKWVGTLGVFVSKLSIAVGAAMVVAGILNDAEETIDSGALRIIFGLVYWPFAAWLRDCCRCR